LTLATPRTSLDEAASNNFRRTVITAVRWTLLPGSRPYSYSASASEFSARATITVLAVKRHAIGTPDRHPKGTPHRRWGRLVPAANRRVPRASRRCCVTATAPGSARLVLALEIDRKLGLS
jgi:hypothetical protein